MNIYWALGLLIAFIAYSSTIYYMGHSAGENHTQLLWDASKLQQAAQLQKIQAQGQAKAAIYEQEAAKARADNQLLQGRLHHAILANAALSACIADADIVSVYQSITAPTVH